MEAKTPMYLAVQFQSDCIPEGKRVWLTLPATKKQFEEAREQASGFCGADVVIRCYGVRVPGMYQSMCMEAPLAQLNHLAARLAALTHEQIVTLCAIIESDHYFQTVEQFIDYTYNTARYGLIPAVKDEEDLAIRSMNIPEMREAPIEVIDSVDLNALGRKLARKQNGVFTSLGYLTSRNGWRDTAPKRKVPATLDLKGTFGEDLYGEIDYEGET